MWEYNGKNYARITDVLRPLLNFGSIPEDVLKKKAAVGTRVHDAIYQDVQGEMPALSIDEQGYFKSFQKWRNFVRPVFVESEVRYYCHTRMITGCIDTLIKLEGEEKCVLVDFKTSVQESKITWPMQAHLYHYLLTIAGKEIADRFLFLKLDKYGNYPKVFQYSFDNTVMERCFQAVDEYWKNNKSC